MGFDSAVLTDAAESKHEQLGAEQKIYAQLSNSMTKPDSQNQIWLCVPGDGHSIDSRARAELGKEVHQYMQGLADSISKQNNGAEIQIDGMLQSIYKGSFCSGADIYPEPVTSGQGPVKQPLKLPRKEDVEADLKLFGEKYQSLMIGNWGNRREMNISSHLSVSTDGGNQSLESYEQKRTWKP